MTSLWHTVRLVLRSSFISSTLIYFRTPTRTFVFQIPFSSHFSLCFLSYSKSWLVHRNLLSYFLYSYIHSIFIQILLMRSSCLPLRTKLLRLLLPSFLLFKILNSQPCYKQSPPLLTPISPLFRRRLLRIVLRFFGYALAPGFLLPPLRAASGIALQPMPGWASLWLLLALSTLSSLRQAKIN